MQSLFDRRDPNFGTSHKNDLYAAHLLSAVKLMGLAAGRALPSWSATVQGKFLGLVGVPVVVYPNGIS